MSFSLEPFDAVEDAAKSFGNENAVRQSFIVIHRGDAVCHLHFVNESLKILLKKRRYDDLNEQIQSLFGSKYSDWLKAYTELLALSVFENEGVLSSVGWPEGLRTKTPPFEGLLKFDEIEIAFDVKNAANSGLYLLEELFRPIVEKWRGKNKIDPVQIEPNFEGPVQQKLIDPNVHILKKNFSEMLNSYQAIPEESIKLEIDFVNDVGKGHKAKVEICIRPFCGIRHIGGIDSPESNAIFVRKVMLKHVDKKMKSAEKYGQKPFFLVYTMPFGNPDSDINPYNTATALRDMECDEAVKLSRPLWLGVIHLNWCSGSLVKKCYLRKNTVLDDATKNIISNRLKFDEFTLTP